MRRIALLLVVGIGLACVVGAQTPLAEIKQVWSMSGDPAAAVDSLAACRMPDGTVRLFATAKKADRVDVFDAATGALLGRWGRSGSRVGEFRYPNGIVAVTVTPAAARETEPAARRFVLVVERDNRRVQAFDAETMKPAGFFGSGELKRPYGAALSTQGNQVYLYVTQAGELPRGETVHVYRLQSTADGIQAEHVRAFGDQEGQGAIGEAESIVIDDDLGRVLLCDEVKKDVKVYDLQGRFTGTVFGSGLIKGDPEGIVIWPRAPGYIILTDQQKELTTWHAFDRRTFEHVLAFTGQPRIANTDGICLYGQPFGTFADGAFFAVHDDADVRAYTLGDLAERLPNARAPSPTTSRSASAPAE